ncbi:(S)-8-oxocitronellyl enol synthase CYC2-like [Rutidosis leptorrhynchoides]|uniref:(S)-8-oxocitronellyl enol synthase CYC2-like n=1 Tax=Rutidosis leptorrhynchoides TaxID=125765 RepID=UPI003A997D3C
MMQENTTSNVALIVGVTGMVGVSLIECLKKPTVLGGPWTVYGVSRQPLPTWFLSSLLNKYINLDTLDQENTHKILSPLSSQITHLFWLALSVNQTEEENISHNSTMLSNVLKALTSAPDTKLSSVTLQTGTKQYLGPVFDPKFSSELAPPVPPFKEDYPRLPFPNFYHDLEDILASYSNSFSHSVHRASAIVGASTRSFFNVALTLFVYASICKRENYPFRYVGNKYTWEHFWDATDVRVLAEQQIWACVTEKAKFQAFNCTNGDVFTWKQLWKVICNVFDIEFVPFHEKDEFDCVAFMKDKGHVWDSIVEENGLYKTKMEEITCFYGMQMILKQEFQHVCSMNKSREFGFPGYADTLRSIANWVDKYRQMKILPMN